MKMDWASLPHRAFTIGILIKGLDGLLELVGGSALLLTSRSAIRHALALLTRQELIPVAMALMTAFIGYQGYRLFHQPSPLLGLLTAIDVTVTAFIVREWRHLPAKAARVE